jgi:hypothetical protein
MRKKLRHKIYISVFWRKLYWRLKFLELLIYKFIVFYYSLAVKVISPIFSGAYSTNYIFIFMSKLIVLLILAITVTPRLVFLSRKYELLKNLVHFFSSLFLSIKSLVASFLHELQINFKFLLCRSQTQVWGLQ